MSRISEPQKIIAPWIGPGLRLAYPNKRDGQRIAEDLREQIATFHAANTVFRETLRHMIGVHRSESDRTVSGAEEDLIGMAWGSIVPLLSDTLNAIRELRWNPTREWKSPLVIRDFWEIVRAIEKRKPSHEITISNGRRVLGGIFDRGTLDFLATLHRK